MIKEENLLFIISQPRSGSSLLQQLLINTKKVKSVPEPWFMLPLIETYRKTNNQSGFNAYYAHINFMEYMERFPGSLVELIKDIQKLALKLYNYNHLDKGQLYFLDKTPRYYHIIHELKELLPDAKFVILVRNPVAVFSSILDYNFRGDINKVFCEDRYHDLFTAPQKIVSVLKNWNREDYHFIKYEDLIEDSNISFNSILTFLNIPKTINDLSYKVGDEFLNTRGIDQKGALTNQNINADYLDSWKKSIDNREKKKILMEYLKRLGPAIINTLGYDYEELIHMVGEHPVKYKFSANLDYIIKNGRALSFKRYIKGRINNKLNTLMKL